MKIALLLLPLILSAIWLIVVFMMLYKRACQHKQAHDEGY